MFDRLAPPLFIPVMNEPYEKSKLQLGAALESGPERLVERAFQRVDGAQVGDGLARQDARQGARVNTGGEGNLPLRPAGVGKGRYESFCEGGCSRGVARSVILERSGRPRAVWCQEAAGVLVAAARRHACHCAREPAVPASLDVLTMSPVLRTLNIWGRGIRVSASVDATPSTLQPLWSTP